MIFGGLRWGPPRLGKYHIEKSNKSGHNLEIQKSRVLSFRTPFDGTYVGPTKGMGLREP